MTKLVNGKRRGRTKLLPGESRGHTISVRLTTGERADLAERAKASGQSNRLGRFLYDRAIARRVPGQLPAVNAEAWSRLGNVAGALTTMAKAASIMRLDTVDRVLIEQVREELKCVRASLIGAAVQDADLDLHTQAQRGRVG